MAILQNCVLLLGTVLNNNLGKFFMFVKMFVTVIKPLWIHTFSIICGYSRNQLRFLHCNSVFKWTIMLSNQITHEIIILPPWELLITACLVLGIGVLADENLGSRHPVDATKVNIQFQCSLITIYSVNPYSSFCLEIKFSCLWSSRSMFLLLSSFSWSSWPQALDHCCAIRYQ